MDDKAQVEILKKTVYSSEELYKLLIKYSRANSCKLIEELLELHPELDEYLYKQDKDGLMPIHHAAYLNKPDILWFLIVKKKVRPDEINNTEQTPLHYAALRSKKSKNITESVLNPEATALFAEKLLDRYMTVTEDLIDDDGDYEISYRELIPAVEKEESQNSEDGTNKGHSHAHIAQKDLYVNEYDFMPSKEMITFLSYGNGDIFNETIGYLASVVQDIDPQDNKGYTPFLNAVSKNNVEGVIELLKCGCNYNSCDKNGQNALHKAMAKDFFALMRILLYKGVDLCKLDQENNTPLHIGAKHGSFASVKLYLACLRKRKIIQEFYILLDKPNDEGFTPLHLALMANAHDIVRLLVANGAHIMIDTQFEENTPLHVAAKNGCCEMTEFLINEGVSINQRNRNGDQAIHLAAQNDDVRVLQYLLRTGKADINSKNRAQMTPYLLAISKDNVEHFNYLVSQGADEFERDNRARTNIFIAAQYNAKNCLKLLMENDKMQEQVDQVDYEQNTPLHCALENNYIECVKILTSIRPSKFITLRSEEIQNDFGQLPLHIAASKGDTNFLNFLAYFGEFNNDKDEFDESPMHIAAKYGYLEFFKKLHEFGGFIDTPNYKGYTPICCAASNGHERMVNYLLEKGSPINPKDHFTIPPLHVACQYGNDELVRKLLENGADPCLRISVESSEMALGSNALDIAIDYDQKECAKAIIWSTNAVPRVLKNRIEIKPGVYDSPMRKLIRYYPDLAKDVLDWCIEMEEDQKTLIYDFELLDDTYSLFPCTTFEKYKCDTIDTSSYDSNGYLTRNSNIYDTDHRSVYNNHILKLMVDERREELLEHPLVEGLTMYKWKKSALFLYSSNLIVYILYMILFNTFMLQSVSPLTLINDTYTMEHFCADSNNNIMNTKSLFIIKILLFILLTITLIIEIITLVKDPINYLLEFDNYLEWIVFVSSLIVIVDFNKCSFSTGIRQPWQWGLGAFTLLGSWMCFTFFLKKLPYFGIYVLLFIKVTQTFLQFSAVYFLFIITFSVTFLLVISKAEGFHGIGQAFMRVLDMSVGEVDFSGIFFDDEHPVAYEKIAFAIMIIFVILVNIILINLTTGLAFNDITLVTKSAKITREALKIELCLDLEYFASEKLKPRFVKKFIKFSMNGKSSFFGSIWNYFFRPNMPDFRSARWTQKEEETTSKSIEKLMDESQEILMRVIVTNQTLELAYDSLKDQLERPDL